MPLNVLNNKLLCPDKYDVYFVLFTGWKVLNNNVACVDIIHCH